MEEIYHVFNKSIAGFTIFNNESEYSRIINVMRYYQKEKPEIKFSLFLKQETAKQLNLMLSAEKKKNIVSIIAYCIMPTHIHFLLWQLEKNGISTFMNNILNSYTRFFNIKHGRKGPLWVARSGKVLVETEEQLMHLTRYIHLNPVTSGLVKKPEEWEASSYREYIAHPSCSVKICDYKNMLDIKPNLYKNFVEDGICYQKELAKIKKYCHDPIPPRRWNDYHLRGGIG